MAINSVYDFSELINQQIENREQASTILSRAEALLVVAINNEFLTNSTLIVYEYLWILNDLIEQALKLNDGSLDTLFQVSKYPF